MAKDDIRNKLGDLICRAHHNARCVIDSNGSEEEAIEEEVRYLLKYGVIVLPCKVGDDVYIIPKYNGKPYCGVVKDKVQMIGITSKGFHIKAKNHRDHNKTYFLGRSAFLNREEAEEILMTLTEDANGENYE